MKSVDKVEKRVEGRHGNVREGQVDDEIIGDSSHAPVGKNNPDDGDVPCDGHQDDEGVRYRPQGHLREGKKDLENELAHDITCKLYKKK